MISDPYPSGNLSESSGSQPLHPKATADIGGRVNGDDSTSERADSDGRPTAELNGRPAFKLQSYRGAGCHQCDIPAVTNGSLDCEGVLPRNNSFDTIIRQRAILFNRKFDGSEKPQRTQKSEGLVPK